MNRTNSGTPLDFDELRRRHEQYKQRSGQSLNTRATVMVAGRKKAATAARVTQTRPDDVPAPRQSAPVPSPEAAAPAALSDADLEKTVTLARSGEGARPAPTVPMPASPDLSSDAEPAEEPEAISEIIEAEPVSPSAPPAQASEADEREDDAPSAQDDGENAPVAPAPYSEPDDDRVEDDATADDEEGPYDDEEPYDEEEPYDDEENEPSPFAAFGGILKNLKDRFGRKGSHADDEAYRDDAADDRGEDEPYDEEDDEDEPPRKRRFSLPFGKPRNDRLHYDDSDYADGESDEDLDGEATREIPAGQKGAYGAADPLSVAEDVDPDGIGGAPPVSRRPDRHAQPDEWDDGDFDPDEDDSEPKPRGLKRLLNLFLVRDDEKASDDEDEDDVDAFDFEQANPAPDAPSDDEPSLFAPDRPDEPGDEAFEFWDQNMTPPEDFSDWSGPATKRRQRTPDTKGGKVMEERTSVTLDTTELMAQGMESMGMSRRERRERAARLAAEEAARRAADEAARRAAEETGRETQPEAEAEEEPAEALFDEEASEGTVALDEPVAAPEQPSFAEAAKGPVFMQPEAEPEPAGQEEADDVPEEPTRIFTRLNDKAAEKRAPADEDDEDDEDDEEEAPRRRSRFTLFHKKDDGEDLEDDEEDDDLDDDEEDEEPPKKQKKGGLFSKKRPARVADEDDDEDEDEDEDEDDYDDEDDDYDAYDDYDDEDDDYDDEDDDDRPAGMHVIGFFKGLLGIILVLLLIVVALNFLDYFNIVRLDGVWNRYHDRAPTMFDTLFPSHDFKKPVEVVPEPTMVPVVTPTPAPTDEPDVEAGIPALPDEDAQAAPEEAVAPAPGQNTIG